MRGIKSVALLIPGQNGVLVHFDGEALEVIVREDPVARIRLLPAQDREGWDVRGVEVGGSEMSIGDTSTLSEDAVKSCGLSKYIARLMRAAVSAVKYCEIGEVNDRISALCEVREAFETFQLIPAEGADHIDTESLAWYGREGWSFSIPLFEGGKLVSVIMQRRIMISDNEAGEVGGDTSVDGL